MQSKPCFLALLVSLAVTASFGQTPPLKPRPVPVPVPKVRQAPSEPTEPPAQTVEDVRAHLRFHLPPGWNLTRKDGEISTFHLDARSAPRNAELRAAANLAFNPYPYSTFSGALFYLSVTPHSTPLTCAGQTSTKPDVPIAPAIIDDVAFTRGRDEHGKICTEARDIAYTTLRGSNCIRFDLAVNTFCGGEVSGARDITDAELGNIFGRLEGILQTVQFSSRIIPAGDQTR